MNFLAVLLALGAERLLPRGSALGESHWLRSLLAALRPWPKLASSPALPWLLVLAAAGLTAAADHYITGAVPQILFMAGVLFFCLGPRDLDTDVQRLIAARERGDAAEATRLCQLLQAGPAPDESHRSLLGALFIQSHERLFGVLLWSLLLGPAAAVAYRIASRLPTLMPQLGFEPTAQQGADQLHALLAWLPARLTAGLFALAGSMDDAIQTWRRLGELHYQGAWRHHSWAVLAEVSAAALTAEEEGSGSTVAPDLAAALREVLRMQTRALLILLAGFAVFTSGSLL